MKILVLLIFLLGHNVQYNVQPYPKVYVEWIDIIATDSGWHSSEDIDYWIKNESDTVKQVGFLYKESKTHIILVDSFITSTYVGAATKIPKGNIVNIIKYY